MLKLIGGLVVVICWSQHCLRLVLEELQHLHWHY